MSPRKLTTMAVAAGLLAVAAPAQAAPPANDGFDQASPLGLPARIAGTLDEATHQDGEPATGVQTVWYSFQSPKSQRVAVEVPESTYGVLLNVYTGSSVSSLQRVAAAAENYPLRAVLDAQAGETYRIAVGVSFQATDARFHLRLRPAPLPANDAFANARQVSVPGRYTGNLADATAELGEPSHMRGAKPARSVWFRFRARRTGRLSIQATSPGCLSPVGVYTGTRLDAVHRVGGSNGTVRFRARRGQTYRVAVDCAASSLGDYELTISDGSIAGKGVNLTVDPGQTVASARSSGLKVDVTTRRKVHVGIELRVSSRTARTLGLGSRVLGRARGTLDYNEGLPANIRLSSAARRALSGVASLSASVRVTLRKSDAPNRVLTVPVRLPN